MMLDIERALNQERLLRALTGLNRKGFDALLEDFSILYEQTRQTQPRALLQKSDTTLNLLN